MCACVGHGRTDNIFLVPMHGGIWTLCIDLTEHEMRQLGPYGFPNAVKCISYLAENTDINASEEYSQHNSYQSTRRPSMSEPLSNSFASFYLGQWMEK